MLCLVIPSINFCDAIKHFENDIKLKLCRLSCSRRPRLEPVFNQPVAGLRLSRNAT